LADKILNNSNPGTGQRRYTDPYLVYAGDDCPWDENCEHKESHIESKLKLREEFPEIETALRVDQVPYFVFDYEKREIVAEFSPGKATDRSAFNAMEDC